MGEQQQPDRYEHAPYVMVRHTTPKSEEHVVSSPAHRTGHDRATGRSGTLSGVYRTDGPVTSGAGFTEVSSADYQTILRPTFRTGGEVALAAASLKGVIRAIFEGMTKSCLLSKVTVNGLEQCSVPSTAIHREANWQAKAKLCPACHVFGGQGFLGRVRIVDAFMENGDTEYSSLPMLWPPRPKLKDGTPNPRYFQNGDIRGRKFYRHGHLDEGVVEVETVSAGRTFAFTADFVDMEDAHLGALLLAVGCQPPSPHRQLRLKVGGSKPSCCGSVTFELTQLVIRDDVARWQASADDAPGALSQLDPNGPIDAALAAEWFFADGYSALQSALGADGADLRTCGYTPQQRGGPQA